jgi:hypothetical protein
MTPVTHPAKERRRYYYQPCRHARTPTKAVSEQDPEREFWCTLHRVYERGYTEPLSGNRHLVRTDFGTTAKVILPEKQIDFSPKVADL